MNIVEGIEGYFQIQQDIALKVSDFFTWYSQVGRAILDYLHILFDNFFYVLLYFATGLSALYFIIMLTVHFKKKIGKSEASIAEKDLPTVTVQIPTFNELAAINCAQKCLDFDYPKEKFEIIIGNDSNKASVTRKIHEFAAKHANVKVTERGSNSGYKPGNLNHMLKHSMGEIIVIFDSDFLPERDFLRRIVAPFAGNWKIAGVQARWRIYNSGQNLISILGTTIASTFHYLSLPFARSLGGVSVLCGSAEAVRKDTLVRLGGWDSGNLTEDIEYSLRLIKNGYKIEYLEKLECDCEVPYTLKDLYRQQMRWAYGVIKSFKMHFRDLFASKKLHFKEKALVVATMLTGYFLSGLLAGLFLTGLLSLITHRPAPIEWARFGYEISRNILITSGLIIASSYALSKARQRKLVSKMLVSSFSVGLIVTYYVNIGVLKALFAYPMEWFMLNKKGNSSIAKAAP